MVSNNPFLAITQSNPAITYQKPTVNKWVHQFDFHVLFSGFQSGDRTHFKKRGDAEKPFKSESLISNEMKTNHYKSLLLIAITFALICTSCSTIKFSGFEKKTIENKIVPVNEDLKNNLDFQNEMIGKLVIPDELYTHININQPTILADYSRVPFVKYDSSLMEEKGLNTYILNLVNYQLIKDALKHNVRLLENNPFYNSFDNNYDEYEQMIVSEIRDCGIKLDEISKNYYIREGVLDVNFKVLNKNGFITFIVSQRILKSDTLQTENINQISEKPPQEGYATAIHREFNYQDNNLRGDKTSPIIDLIPTPEKSVSTEVVTGIVFSVPNNTKSYPVYVVPSGTKNPLVFAGVKSSSTKILNVKSNKTRWANSGSGSNYEIYEAVYGIPEIKNLFTSTDKIQLYNKATLLCKLQLLPDGSIVEIF